MAIPSKISSPSIPFPMVDIGSYPNPRHLEIWSTSRKNLNGNLFKKPSILADPKGFNDVRPASTHSDFPWIGKECCFLLHNSQKQSENDKNFKPVRIRCLGVSKDTKDVIIPKIAASSRNKVLVKRNELVQTSASAFSYEKIKPISLLLFLLLVGCLWRTITDAPLVSYTIDYSTDKMSSSIELFEAAEVTEFERTNLDQMTRKLRLWSNNTSPCFSKMINIGKESSGLSFLQFGDSHDAHNIIADEYEGQFSLASDVEPEVDKLQSEGKTISDAEFVASAIDHKAQSIITEKEQNAQIPVAFEIKSELPQAEKLHQENSQIFKELCLSLKEKSSIVDILGASFLILTLIVVAGLIFLKPKKSHTVSTNSIPLDQLQAEKLASMPTKSKENTNQEKLFTRNWPTEDGESCPPEISSFQRTVSYSIKESKGVSEAQSQERGLEKRNKQDSLTSSSGYSMASLSNGSCTSYEKIQNKQELKSKKESEFSSELAAGIDICSQIRLNPPSLASCRPAVGADPSVPPYDPKTNYIAPRPRSEYLTVSSSYSKNELKGASSASECLMVSSCSSKNELKEAGEVQNQQGVLRKSNIRESLASHSDCSIRSTSYGSFTSYEKISRKNGGGQEVVIPVRRSCRIKKHVASS